MKNKVEKVREKRNIMNGCFDISLNMIFDTTIFIQRCRLGMAYSVLDDECLFLV